MPYRALEVEGAGTLCVIMKLFGTHLVKVAMKYISSLASHGTLL